MGMRMDNGGDDSDGGSEGSMGGFGGIDSPSAARAPGSSAEVWRVEEDAADGAAREAYTAKLSTAREAWEKELEKEDANARRRRELERDKEQLRLDQEEAKVRREMEERFERVALELKKASVRREEEAEATATAKEKEAESRTKEAEELLRLAAEKIADAKAKSAAAAAIVAESEGSVHAQTERSVKFLDAEKARLSKEEEDKIRGEIEPEISALRAKLEAERDALKRQVEDAAKETARAKTNDEAGGRIAALMAATESHVIPEIEEMHVKAAQSSAQRRIEMAEARAQAAEEEARHRISDAEEAVIAADKQAMDAINAAKAQERSVPYVSESEDEGFTIKRKSPSRGSGRSSRTSARGLDSDSDGDDSDGGFESLRGDEERTIERFDPDENPAIASPGGKINVASLRSAVAAGDDEMMLARARSFLRDQRRHSEERRTATQRASSEWRAAEIALMEPGMDEDLREKRRSMIKAIRAALDVSMSAFTAEMRVMRALKVAVRSAAYTGASWPAVFSSTIMAKRWDPNEFDPKEVFGRLEPAPGAGASRAARGTRRCGARHLDVQGRVDVRSPWGVAAGVPGRLTQGVVQGFAHPWSRVRLDDIRVPDRAAAEGNYSYGGPARSHLRQAEAVGDDAIVQAAPGILRHFRDVRKFSETIGRMGQGGGARTSFNRGARGVDGKVQGEHGHGIEGMAPTEADVQARPGPRLLRADDTAATRAEVELRKRGGRGAGAGRAKGGGRRRGAGSGVTRGGGASDDAGRRGG